MLFEYPSEPHIWQHGPLGYVDYQSYKPWLRDEFAFQCVYCLTREQWSSDGDASFGVDHIVPKSVAPEFECEYENLLYVCNRCNVLKNNYHLPAPNQIPYGIHLRVEANGRVEAISPQGRRLVTRLHLNYSRLISVRRRWLTIYRVITSPDFVSDLSEDHILSLTDLLPQMREWFNYPEDLPDLSVLRPPDGNNRPEGITNSHYARRERGELPEIY